MYVVARRDLTDMLMHAGKGLLLVFMPGKLGDKTHSKCLLYSSRKVNFVEFLLRSMAGVCVCIAGILNDRPDPRVS